MSVEGSGGRRTTRNSAKKYILALLVALLAGPRAGHSSARTTSNGTLTHSANLTKTSLSGIEVAKLGYTYAITTGSSISEIVELTTNTTDKSLSDTSSSATDEELSDFMNVNARVPTKTINVTKIIEEKVNFILTGLNLTDVVDEKIPNLEAAHSSLPLPYLSHRGVFGSPQSLSLPLKVYSVNGALKLSLEVRSYRWSNELFSFTTRAFCTEDGCSVPGPTLFVRPSDALEIQLTSRLDAAPVNDTNLFFYGLGVDPASNPASRVASAGGGGAEYRITVPATHHPGVHWYSSRVGGMAALQIMGGLVGAVVVEPSDDQLEAMPPFFSSVPREVLVLTHIYAERDDALGYSASINNSYAELARKAGLALPMDFHFTAANNGSQIVDAWFCNGQYQPVMALPLAEWRVLDIIVAAADRMVELELKDAVGNSAGAASCDVRLLAIDGAYLARARRAPYSTHIPVPMGGRVTLAVKCGTEGVYYLQSSGTTDKSSLFYELSDESLKSAQNLLTINATGASTRVNLEPPDDMSGVPRPQHRLLAGLESSWSIASSTLTSLSSSASLPSPGLGVGADCTLPCFSNESCVLLYGPSYSVKSYPSVESSSCFYDGALAHTSRLGAVEELVVWGTAATQLVLSLRHAPMQFVSFTHSKTVVNSRDESADSYFYENLTDYYSIEGDFRDTWPALAGKAVFRLYFSDYVGIMPLINTNAVYDDIGLAASFLVAASTAVSAHAKAVNSSTESAVASAGSAGVADTTGTGSGSGSDVTQDLQATTLAEFCDVAGSSHFYSEEIDTSRRVRIVLTSSCPNHFSVCQASGCGGRNSTYARVAFKTLTLPLYPTIATLPRDRTCSADSLGVALNGVAIKGPVEGATSCMSPSDYGYRASGRTACPLRGSADGVFSCGDMVRSRGRDFDKCGGYTDPTSGEYSYHMSPVCLLQQLQAARQNLTTLAVVSTPVTGYETTISYASTASVSPQVGWAMDGFPIYGPYGAGGVAMLRCGLPNAHASLCLDECNGYEGALPQIDSFAYRYYFSGGSDSTGHCSESIVDGSCSRLFGKCCASSLPPATSYPYSLGCLRGCTHGDVSCAPSGVKGTTSFYIPSISSFKSINSTFSEGMTYLTEPYPVDAEVETSVSDASMAAVAAEQVLAQRLPVARVVVVRVPSNGSIVIASKEQGAYTYYDENIVTPGAALISSAALSASSNSLVYATPSGVHALHLPSGKSSTLVAGWTDIVIRGFNFGSNVFDVKYVKVKGTPCASLRHLSSELLACVATNSAANAQQLTADDILVSTVGGNARGVYLYPKLVVQSGSGRPVISGVDITRRLFHPQALVVVSSEAGSRQYIYWTNTAYADGYSIQRCNTDGSRVETVVWGVQRGYGLAQLPYSLPLLLDSGATRAAFSTHSYLNAYDALFFTDSSRGTLSIAFVPPLVDDAVFSVEGKDKVVVVTIMTGLNTPTAVSVDTVSECVFVTVVDGIVASYPLTKVASIVASAVTSGGNVSAVAVVLNDRKSLPTGVKIVLKTQRNSRTTAMTVTTSCAKLYSTNACLPSPWLHQRVFTIDTNRNTLIVSSISGYPTSHVDLTTGFGYEDAIYWPTSISISDRIDPLVEADVTSNIKDRAYGSFSQYYTAYITEYLGKVWRVRIPVSNVNGTISSVSTHRSLLLAPELLLDASQFSLSEKLRARFRALHGGGQRSNVGAVSFEIVN